MSKVYKTLLKHKKHVRESPLLRVPLILTITLTKESPMVGVFDNILACELLSDFNRIWMILYDLVRKSKHKKEHSVIVEK